MEAHVTNPIHGKTSSKQLSYFLKFYTSVFISLSNVTKLREYYNPGDLISAVSVQKALKDPDVSNTSSAWMVLDGPGITQYSRVHLST